ncbi:MAG: hypothetical protein COA73_10155 [Candidatus Hydrogenedentota bacterium]|nr:MAG: hypothetical protein COA73_10155 [Candidatus Hydrogenedentota bacterium]
MNNEQIAELVVNGIFVAFFGLAALFIWKRVILQTSLLNIRYKMFAVRDDLYMRALDGKINESDAEFTYMINRINFFISSCQNLNMFTLLRFVINYEVINDSTSKVIESIEESPEYLEVRIEYLDVIRKAIIQNSLLIRAILQFLVLVLLPIRIAQDSIFNPLRVIVSNWQAINVELKKYRSHYGSIRHA